MQESSFGPSDAQMGVMRGLCSQLNLDYDKVTRPLTSNQTYSAKITELVAAAKAARQANGEKVRKLQPRPCMRGSRCHWASCMGCPLLLLQLLVPSTQQL